MRNQKAQEYDGSDYLPSQQKKQALNFKFEDDFIKNDYQYKQFESDGTTLTNIMRLSRRIHIQYI